MENVDGKTAKPSLQEIKIKGRHGVPVDPPSKSAQKDIIKEIKSQVGKLDCMLAYKGCGEGGKKGKGKGKGSGPSKLGQDLVVIGVKGSKTLPKSSRKDIKKRSRPAGGGRRLLGAASGVRVGAGSGAASVPIGAGEGPGARRRLLMKKEEGLAPGSLGTCALVGNSDGLLLSRYGKEIDAHDSVFRYNAPTDSRFAAHTGKKATVVWAKTPTGNTGFLSMNRMPPFKFHMFPGPWAQKNLGSKPALVTGPSMNAFNRLQGNLYELYEKDQKLKTRASTAGKSGFDKKGYAASKGFKRVLAVSLSSLCTRVDLYGWSAGGGKYFAGWKGSMQRHLLPLEHYAYRVLMSLGRLCLYD